MWSWKMLHSDLWACKMNSFYLWPFILTMNRAANNLGTFSDLLEQARQCLRRVPLIWNDIRNRINSSKSEPHTAKLSSDELREKVYIPQIDLVSIRFQSPLLWIFGSSRTVWFYSACDTWSFTHITVLTITASFPCESLILHAPNLVRNNFIFLQGWRHMQNISIKYNKSWNTSHFAVIPCDLMTHNGHVNPCFVKYLYCPSGIYIIVH